jgi:hypothetical protein
MRLEIWREVCYNNKIQKIKTSMTRKILKQIVCVILLFMAFFPLQLKAAGPLSTIGSTSADALQQLKEQEASDASGEKNTLQKTFETFGDQAQDASTASPPPAPIFTNDGTGDVTDTQSGINTLTDTLGNTGVTGTANIGDLVLKYVNFALPYLALAAFLGFIYAGFLYVTAYGAEEQTTKAKKIMTYAIIGLVVVILSYGIVQLLTGELVKGIQSQTK